MYRLAQCSLKINLDKIALSHEACLAIFRRVSESGLNIVVHGFHALPPYKEQFQYEQEKHDALKAIRALESNPLVKVSEVSEVEPFNPVQYVKDIRFNVSTYTYPMTSDKIDAVGAGLKELVELFKHYGTFVDSKIVFFNSEDYTFIVFEVIDNQAVRRNIQGCEADRETL